MIQALSVSCLHCRHKTKQAGGPMQKGFFFLGGTVLVGHRSQSNCTGNMVKRIELATLGNVLPLAGFMHEAPPIEWMAYL